MRWVAGNGAMEVAILLLVNTSKVLPVSAETQVGTVLAKQAQGVPGPVALSPSQAALLA